ncbi:methylated-DNA--[protein]-cysteine S-methyltransferase [bacterium]|nr:methylated-DNA--[protein]-cysteine S-methyltransferase [bacterium]
MGERGLVHLEFLPRAWEYHTRAHAVARGLAGSSSGSSSGVSSGVASEAASEAAADAAAAGGETAPTTLPVREDPAAFAELTDQLAAYFVGRRTAFDLALDLRGTAFQVRVWRELLKIPYGKTRTYGEVARALQQPKATRAVGQAAGHNPLPIVVPCHRVVGQDGTLVGFAAGITTKARLLRLEGHTLGDSARLEEPRLF